MIDQAGRAYVDVDPPEFVSFTWGWTDPAWHLPPGSSLVSVRLTLTESGTLVSLTHDQLPGDLRAIHNEGWITLFAGCTPLPLAQTCPRTRRRDNR